MKSGKRRKQENICIEIVQQIKNGSEQVHIADKIAGSAEIPKVHRESIKGGFYDLKGFKTPSEYNLKRARGRTMSKNDSVVAICQSDEKAWQAVRKMQQSGLGIHNLSVVGNIAPAGVDQYGDYNAGEWIKNWGFPSDTALFSVSDKGPLAIGDPLVAAIDEGQPAGAVEAEFSALGAGLWRCGVPRQNVPHYETAIEHDNYLVIVHCAPGELLRAKEILESLQVVDIAVHHG